MNITDVRLRKLDNGSKMKAIASITIDDAFVVREIRVIEGQNGLFVAMPSRKIPSGEFRDIAHPINSETRQMIQNIILEEYNKAE
ncbi:MAG: septation regulator SpoVG [Clostridia bacterium]|jgi:stage V sporulation protein G|nr:septation regulator SpoVG [Clostridia bacterium]